MVSKSHYNRGKRWDKKWDNCQLISKFAANMWDIDMKNLAVSHLKQTACNACGLPAFNLAACCTFDGSICTRTCQLYAKRPEGFGPIAIWYFKPDIFCHHLSLIVPKS